jgi:hypothetical protein
MAMRAWPKPGDSQTEPTFTVLYFYSWYNFRVFFLFVTCHFLLAHPSIFRFRFHFHFVVSLSGMPFCVIIGSKLAAAFFPANFTSFLSLGLRTFLKNPFGRRLSFSAFLKDRQNHLFFPKLRLQITHSIWKIETCMMS